MGRSPWLRVYAHVLCRPRYRTRFRSGSAAEGLTSLVSSNSPDHNAKGTQSAAVRRRPPPTACRHMVSGSLSLPARGAFHLSLTVLVHYRSHEESLALEGGPPSFTPDSSCRALLRNSTRGRRVSPTGLSPSLAPRSRGLHSGVVHRPCPWVLQPRPTRSSPGLGSSPFRSPLLRESRLISLPPGTEMFQFPGFASSEGMTRLAPRRVSPFGHLGITACVPLPRAYRSLPRPSSPPCAQASPTCLRSLD